MLATESNPPESSDTNRPSKKPKTTTETTTNESQSTTTTNNVFFAIEADAAEDKGSRHTMEDTWLIIQDSSSNLEGKLRSF